MKILVATDLHGSSFYTQKIVDIYSESKADVLMLLGDIYNHGPRNPYPQDHNEQSVAEILATVENLIAIKGNCDSEVDDMISNFTFTQHNTLVVDGRKLFFTHGHIYNSTNLPKGLNSGDVIFCGHFHINDIDVTENGVVTVCVGSPSLPKDGHRSFCIVDDSKITLYTIDKEVLAEYTF